MRFIASFSWVRLILWVLPCCTRNVARQAAPPIIIEMHKIHRLPKRLRLGHKKIYVGSSQAPAMKKLKISSPPCKARMRNLYEVKV